MLHSESQTASPSIATTFTHLVLELKPLDQVQYPFESQNSYNPVTFKTVPLTDLVIEALKEQLPEVGSVEESFLLRVDVSVEVLERRSITEIKVATVPLEAEEAECLPIDDPALPEGEGLTSDLVEIIPYQEPGSH